MARASWRSPVSSLSGSLAAGPCAPAAALWGFHQPGVLHLQLLLLVVELQTRGAQEGLQRGESPRWAGGRRAARPVFQLQYKSHCLTRAGQSSCSSSLGQLCLLWQRSVPWRGAQMALTLLALPGLPLLCGECVCEREREYSKKSAMKVTYRSTDLRPFYKVHFLCPYFPLHNPPPH